MVHRLTPKSIKNHKYAFVFEPEWERIHNRREGNSFNFFIGGNGTGKTYASLTRMEIVGVDENDSYGRLFDPDRLENHLFFDKNEMLTKIAELEKQPLSYRRGYQLDLDEAQMTANAKQWNDKDVLNFSKEMTTIRSSRLSITLTMPTHRMITTDLRQLGTYQVEMYPAERMEMNKGISHSKLHFLTLQPHLGEVWRKRPLVVHEYLNPITGLPTIQRGRLNDITWKLPSLTVRRNYEKLKKDFRKRSAEALAEKAKIVTTNKSPQEKFFTWLDEARKRKENYRDEKKIFAWNKIVKDLNCGVSSAYKIVKILKDEEVVN
jgi:hypothetical protein